MTPRDLPRALLVALVTLLALAGLAGLSQAAAPRGSVSVRLVDAPTDRRDDPRARVYVVDHVSPGTRLSRRIEVANRTAAPQDLQLYAAAAGITAGGWSVADGRSANELTAWTSVEPPSLRLAPGETRTVTTHIDVPADASSGERYAAVLAELPTRGGQVAVTNRVGIRVYLDVDPGGEPASSFTIDDLVAGRDLQGRPVATAHVRNTGGRAVDLTGQLSLDEGPGGVSAGPFPVPTTRTLAIGGAGDVVVPLDPALPAGPWQAHLDLTSGTTREHIDARLQFPDAGAPVATSALLPDARGSRGGSDGVVALLPWALALALFLLLLLLLLRRRRRQPPAAATGLAT